MPRNTGDLNFEATAPDLMQWTQEIKRLARKETMGLECRVASLSLHYQQETLKAIRDLTAALNEQPKSTRANNGRIQDNLKEKSLV